jgi:type IV pilus assembly protein PilB
MNTRLIDYLQSKGILDQVVADNAKVELVKSGMSEEQILINKDLASEMDIARAKSEMFNIPFVDLDTKIIPEELLNIVSADRLKKLSAIPFEKVGNSYNFAMSDPFDIQAIQVVQNQLPSGSSVKVFIATTKQIESVLERKLGEVIGSEVNEALEDVDQGQVMSINSEDTGSLDDSNIQNAPVTRIVNSIFSFAIKANASDIHIEPMESKLRVRFRIHGILTEKLSLPKNLTNAVISRIKIMSNLKIDEKRIPQDGRIPLKTAEKKVDIRVSTLPSVYGETIVMRLLESGSSVPVLESSGLRGNAYKVLVDAIKSTNGIILVTGPTSAGKTQTLASILSKLNDPKVNIITLENPVEIRVPGVNQVQINPDAGLTFATGLRAILRQDPNIIMVGEIRDQETAQLAVEASLTGHLVLATLHTNSAATAIPRLVDMGVESYLLASTLRLAAAQRLPRKICQYCKVAYAASKEELESINETMASITGFDVFNYCTEVAKNSASNPALQGFHAPESDVNGNKVLYLYKGGGCDRCNGSGYMGRIGIFEIMNITDKISRMITEGKSAAEIEDEAVSNGMLVMRQDGYLKALEGITTIEDVLRVSKD